MKSNLFVIQHPISEDLERVFNFMIACDIAEYGEPDSDIDDLSDQWSETDLTQDAWISIDHEGNLIGYTLLSDEINSRRYLDLYTNSSSTPREAIEALLDLAVERFRTLVDTDNKDTVSLTLYANGLNISNRQVIESRGFEVEKYHYRMQMDFQAPYPAPAWPADYTLSSFTVQDERELFDLIVNAFDWEGVKLFTFEDWHKTIFRGGRFDPELFVMVRHSGRLVGAAICYDEESRIWLKELAVSKELQGQGIGSLLLKQVFALAGKRGIPTVALGVVSTNKKASEFYERSGMTRTREFVQYYRKA